jgi:4-aminobutyrate aminotransferase-like enzyme
MSSTGAWAADRVAREVQSTALRHGLLFELVGRGGIVARFLPPLNLTLAEADEALDILAYALAETDRLCRTGEASNG